MLLSNKMAVTIWLTLLQFYLIIWLSLSWILPSAAKAFPASVTKKLALIPSQPPSWLGMYVCTYNRWDGSHFLIYHHPCREEDRVSFVRIWLSPSWILLGGPAQAFPPIFFFCGGRPSISKRPKPPKKQTDAEQSEAFFLTRWESPPPIVAILRLISSSPGRSIVKSATVTPRTI